MIVTNCVRSPAEPRCSLYLNATQTVFGQGISSRDDQPKKWSREVAQPSDALDLARGIIASKARGISRSLRRSTEEIFLASPSPFSRLCRGLIFYSSVVQFGNCSAPVGAFERPELRLCKGLERTPSTLPTLVEIAPNCIEISHFPILAFREEPSCLLRRELVTRLRLR
jgi:Protein of unknown function (DUF3175)